MTDDRVFGASESWVMRCHLLTNARDPSIVQDTVNATPATTVEIGMSFIGLRVRLPTPSLANLLHGSWHPCTLAVLPERSDDSAGGGRGSRPERRRDDERRRPTNEHGGGN